MRASTLRLSVAALALAYIVLACAPCIAQRVSATNSSTRQTMDQVVDRAIEREHALTEMLKTRTPLIETYLQELKFDPQAGPVPDRDYYFLGRVDLAETVDRRDYLPKGSFKDRLLGGFSRLYRLEYKPLGFTWMMFIDRTDFDRSTYDFSYVHREFLGDVRCLVFEVTPKQGKGDGRFRGRVWVEDQNYNIVRFNGIYGPGKRNSYFFHMDSWRLNLTPGYWLPSYIYSEEGDLGPGSKHQQLAFKAQSRLWAYNLRKGVSEGEFTDVVVDSTVKDASPTAQDPSPLQAEHLWMQQAADNVIERLQNAGLLAPAGDLDKVLNTVVSNLLVTNNLELELPVHVRVMLTSPLESFSVGNTIVVSRGLLDVLPDESSLAAVLAHELAHILLGHNIGSKYAFSDRMLFSDESVYRNFGFRRTPGEEDEADRKAIDLLKSSPYSQKMDTAGLFLRQLAKDGSAISALCTPHLGNGFTDNKGKVTRMVALMNSSPTLDEAKLDQTAALPLGGRVKVNAWDDRVELIKTKPAVINSARDKMPLEVTPFFPHLTRYDSSPDPTATARTNN